MFGRFSSPVAFFLLSYILLLFAIWFTKYFLCWASTRRDSIHNRVIPFCVLHSFRYCYCYCLLYVLRYSCRFFFFPLAFSFLCVVHFARRLLKISRNYDLFVYFDGVLLLDGIQSKSLEYIRTFIEYVANSRVPFEMIIRFHPLSRTHTHTLTSTCTLKLYKELTILWLAQINVWILFDRRIQVSFTSSISLSLCMSLLHNLFSRHFMYSIFSNI